NKPVSLAGDRLDVLRLFGIVLQYLPNLSNRSINRVVCIKETASPNLGDNLFPLNDGALFFHKQDQDVHGHPLHLEHLDVAQGLSRLQVEFESLSNPHLPSS